MVELDTDVPLAERVDTGKLRYFVERFRALAADHGEDLPKGEARPTALVGSPVHLANQALHRLRLWVARVDYLKEHLAELTAERDYLTLLEEVLEAMQREGLDLDGLSRRTRFLCKCLFACPKGCCGPGHAFQSLVTVVVHGREHDFPFLIGLPDRQDIIRRMVLEEGCEQVGIPPWLTGEAGQQRQQVQARLKDIGRRIVALAKQLADLRADPAIAEALANIETLAWFLDHAAAYLSGGQLCRVTGWTTAEDPESLQHALWDAGIRVIVRFPEPPPGTAPPVTTLQSWWAQPFRPLVLMWGTPGRQEVDPSGILALVVPLLFGYMFGDVGHGLLIALFAAFAWRPWPQVRFLLPCGVAAMAFGVLFGEVFGFERVIPALWLRPLDDPMTVLAVPLVFGVFLMLLGLAFAGMEAHWRGELGTWLRVDTAVLLLYASLLASLLLPEARGLAGLAHAIMTLADGVGHPLAWLLVVAAGNAFSVVLEGLVVFVQTTRLVLFEFFIRFLQAEGRLFRPLRQPAGKPA